MTDKLSVDIFCVEIESCLDNGRLDSVLVFRKRGSL